MCRTQKLSFRITILGKKKNNKNIYKDLPYVSIGSGFNDIPAKRKK